MRVGPLTKIVKKWNSGIEVWTFFFFLFQADDDHDSGTESDDEFQNSTDVAENDFSGKILNHRKYFFKNLNI